MPRPPSAKSIIRNIKKKQRFEPKTEIATDMFLPNHSGDHGAGRMLRTPENETDMANKAYVDSIATRSEIDLFLTENASDIATYFDLEVDIVTAAKENIVQSITAGSTTLIASFSTILDEPEIDNIDLLESGVYPCHLHAEGQSAKNLFFFCEFYHRTAGGTETLLGTSHDSAELSTSEVEYDVHSTITSDKIWASGDRVVVKVHGRNDGNADRNITIYMEGQTASRAEIPGFVSPNFVAAHASSHELLGSDLVDHDNLTNFASNEHFTEASISHTNITAGDGSDHSNVVTNSTHVAGDGSDHADVATNSTHTAGDGSDHADVASNTTHAADNSQAHSDYLINNGNDSTSGRITMTDMHVEKAGEARMQVRDTTAGESIDIGIKESDGVLFISRGGTGGEDDITIDRNGDVIIGARGDIQLGNASTTAINCTSRFLPRQVSDANMNSTNGTEGEIVYNTVDNDAYVCSVTGTPATWKIMS